MELREQVPNVTTRPIIRQILSLRKWLRRRENAKMTWMMFQRKKSPKS